MEQVQQAETMGGGNPKEIVVHQNSIRENLRLLGEEWRELEGVYKAEARKRKVRDQYTLSTRNELCFSIVQILCCRNGAAIQHRDTAAARGKQRVWL
jgi:hypothetical protein